MDPKRELLRHALATVAYRASRAVCDAPDEFGNFDGAGRKPVEILAHMGDLFDWALTIAKGEQQWHKSTPLAWREEKQRFFSTLTAFEDFLASQAELHADIERLMQGPVADALTHIGQLAMLRRLSGSRTRRENFYVAPIVTGRVGAEQAEPEQKS
jgi:hypothetical protein